MANTFNQAKPQPKEKTNASPKLNLSFNTKLEFMEDKRFRISAGAFLLVIAFNLFFSFTSFLFSGIHDFSVVESFGDVEFKYLVEDVDNGWGVLGASLSQYLIMRWFGIGVYSMIPILLLYAANLLFNKKKFNKWCSNDEMETG